MMMTYLGAAYLLLTAVAHNFPKNRYQQTHLAPEIGKRLAKESRRV